MWRDTEPGSAGEERLLLEVAQEAAEEGLGGIQTPKRALQEKAAEPNCAALRGESKAASAEELPALGEGCFPPGDG